MTEQQTPSRPASTPGDGAARAPIAGRYRPVRRVARADTHDVWLAEDQHLQRPVDLLLLRPELGDDPAAVGLFAATVAATVELSHPAIAGILDAGIDGHGADSVRWAVREHVPDAPLPLVDQSGADLETFARYALEVAMRVAAGMQTAHSHGIIHGALGPAVVHATPATVEPVRVKITGFGPQPADITDLANPVVTRRMWARFTAGLPDPSPEQRAGAAPSPRSDIHGYGVLLDRLLALGDDQLGWAAVEPGTARIIHEALRALARHAMSEAPSSRPYSFALIETELRGIAGSAPTGALALPDPPTTLVPGLGRTGALDATPTEVLAPLPAHDRTRSARDAVRDRLGVDAPAGAGRRGPLLLLVIAAVVAAVLGIVIVLGGALFPTAARPVPDVVGRSVEDARRILEDAGFALGGTREQPDLAVPAGLVAGADPAIGEPAAAGAPITLLISTGPDLVPVPQVEGLSLAAAQDALAGAGLATGEVRHWDSTLAAGTVLGSDPDYGEQALRGSAIVLIVASGSVTVPEEIVGQTPQAAAAQLQSLGLQVQTRRETTGSVAPGLVAGSDPGAGASVPLGGIVTLIVAVAPLPTPTAPPAPAPTPTLPPPTPEPEPPADDEPGES